MRQRFFLNLNFAELPKVIVSAKVWKVQIRIPYELAWKEKIVNERTYNWKILQVLN